MSVVDSIAMSLRGLVKVVLVLLGVTVVGALLAGAVDVFAPGVIQGTPLGRGSAASPLLWTIIAAGLLWGVQEVRD